MEFNPTDFYVEYQDIELCKAIKVEDIAAVKSITNNPYFKLNKSGKYNMTFLLWASIHNVKLSFAYLLKNGANINFKTEDGTQLIALLAGADNPEFLKIALENKADPNGMESGNLPAIFNAITQQRWENLRLLVEFGCDIDCLNSFSITPVLQLVMLNEFQQAYYLLEAGANYKFKDKFGNTVEKIATKRIIDPKSEENLWRNKLLRFIKDKEFQS